MSMMMPAPPPPGIPQGRYNAPLPPDGTTDPGVNAIIQPWTERRKYARTDRRRFEPTWDLCKAFLSGRQWVGIHPRTGRVIRDQRFDNRERHTVDVVTQFHQTVMGKLFVEDLRPTLLFGRTDEEARGTTDLCRALLRYTWDIETDADQRLYTVIHKLAAFGTSALRCMFDPSQGAPIGDMPIGLDGQPMTDPQEARLFVAQAQEQGQQVQFKSIREGKIVWDVLGPRNILVPPGIEQDYNFPWVIIDVSMPVDWIKLRFPNASGEVQSENLTSLDGLDNRELPTEDFTTDFGGSGRLKEHATISYGYEMPTEEHQNGQVITWNEGSSVLLDQRDTLPYMLKGRPHHGIVFFHYHRVPDRFWGKGVVEGLIGPQRQKNRARSQMIEMKDRNLGRVYARKGSITVNSQPKGKIMELIEIPLHADFPVETAGVPPGAWIENEARMNDEDMNRVAGLSDVTVSGQPPAGIAAYAALALLAEQDERRIGPVLKALRLGIGDTIYLTLELCRKYWPDGKKMSVAGPDNSIEVFNFSRALLPDEFYIDVSAASPLPTSPAAEAQKIFDLWNAMIAGGQALPGDWLYDSLAQGKALPLPKREQEVQKAKADQENVMMYEGMMVVPAYYDDDFVHVQEHRNAQVQWGGVPGQEQFVMNIEHHIQMHMQNAQLKNAGGVTPGPSVPGSTAGGQPQMQGSRGVEAQNGPHVNLQGAAQTASGTAPPIMPGGFGGNG